MKIFLSNHEIRIMYCIVLGYACYYTVRQNFNIIFADDLFAINQDYEIIGWAFTINATVYGLGKIVNGFLSDRVSSKIFFSLGLFISGLLSIIAGLYENITLTCIIFIVNGWIQSMGFPATAKLMLSWTSKDKIASRWSIATCSHQIGGVSIMVIGGIIMENFGWKYVLIFPGLFAVIASIIMFLIIKDSPKEVNIEILNSWKDSIPSSGKQLFQRLLFDKNLQLLCLGNMFAYTIRLGILNWSPIFLTQYYNLSLSSMGLHVGFYEATGIIGCVFAGFITDKYYKNSTAYVGILSILISLVLMITISRFFYVNPMINFITMGIIGFFVYIPQVLVGIMSTKISKKSDIGSVNGFIGMFGYIGSAISGIGYGTVVTYYGWEGGYLFFITMGILCLLIFLQISYNEKNKKWIIYQI